FFFFSLTSSLFPPIFFFFFNHTPTTEIYTLSLHDALPISDIRNFVHERDARRQNRVRRVLAQLGARRIHQHDGRPSARERRVELDRKSTRLNSSHRTISYAVFCLKKKKKKKKKE